MRQTENSKDGLMRKGLNRPIDVLYMAQIYQTKTKKIDLNGVNIRTQLEMLQYH